MPTKPRLVTAGPPTTAAPSSPYDVQDSKIQVSSSSKCLIFTHVSFKGLTEACLNLPMQNRNILIKISVVLYLELT